MDEIWERAVETALDGQTDFASVRTLTLDGAVKCVHGRLPPPALFERFQNLQHLSIANIGVSSLEQFPRLHNLQKLILSDNRIAAGLEFLVEAGLNSLRDLDLSNNRIQDIDDLRPLAELKLVSLDLVSNGHKAGSDGEEDNDAGYLVQPVGQVEVVPGGSGAVLARKILPLVGGVKHCDLWTAGQLTHESSYSCPFILFSPSPRLVRLLQSSIASSTVQSKKMLQLLSPSSSKWILPPPSFYPTRTTKLTTATFKVRAMANQRSESDGGGIAEKLAIVGGLVSTPVIGWSLYTLKTTGCGLPPGPGGSIGALEGVSYLVVAAIVGWSFYTKTKTGSGLPSGPFGLLGAVEGLSYLCLLAIIAVFGLQFLDKGSIPGPLPSDQCFG
nr:acidic leucine-rich nuclear phosphoprotein 32-related protein [Ipomoea batatas]